MLNENADLYTRTADTLKGRDNMIFLACFNAIQGENYRLPQFAPITQRIAQHFQQNEKQPQTLHEHAKLLQLDPTLAVNFLQLTNQFESSNSIPEAIARVGTGHTQDLINALTRDSLTIDYNNELIMQLSLALWEHSYLTAAFCAILASNMEAYDPDIAMLAGLLHDIGSIPVISIAHRYAHLENNPINLDTTMRELQQPISGLLCQHFNLPDFIAEAMRNSENYNFLSQQRVNYAELVTLAHICMDQPTEAGLKAMPLGQKMSSQLNNSKTLQGILAEAKEDVWETYRVLQD